MRKLTRRAVITTAAAMGIGATGAIMKPQDKSGPRDDYFLTMQAALKAEGIASPTLVVDRERLTANAQTLKGHLPSNMGFRVVAKSLPSLGLLEHVKRETGTDRLMTFNWQMLKALSEAFPDDSQLLGKPLPVQAAKTYFDQLSPEARAAAGNIEWLVDTPERLAQYEELARAEGLVLATNIELDVGMHRGGVAPGTDLQLMLERIKTSDHLTFAGFMGYEPHIPAIPTTLGWRDRALKGAWDIYQNALQQAEAVFGRDAVQNATRNAAGSPTYRYYQNTKIANEIAAGSCLVKPTNFDTELLEPHLPASFIATPVIKSLPTTRLPGLEFAEGAVKAWNPNASKTVFIYGGHWLAEPVDPPGLEYNSTFGRSSNQEMLNGGPDLDLAVDDFVFLRPQQSEAVFLQFGDIAVFSEGKIVDFWPVFPASA